MEVWPLSRGGGFSMGLVLEKIGGDYIEGFSEILDGLRVRAAGADEEAPASSFE